MTLTTQPRTYMFLPQAPLFPSPDTRGTPSCIHITSSGSISLQRAVSVALAVRMSTSIPLLFEPVSFINPKTGREHLLVDGGMLSNFPVWLFDSDEPLWPTIGLKFVEEDPRAPLATSRVRGGLFGLVGYARSLVETMMEAHDRFYLEETDFRRTIAIDSLGVRTTEFGLSRERALELYASGRAAAEEFLTSGRDAFANGQGPREGDHLHPRL